jgi:hypothetical protein
VRYYLMDNEPSLWHETHRHVRLKACTPRRWPSVSWLCPAVKAADPSAKVVAPEEWGWSGYLNSGFDQQGAAAGRDPGRSDRATQTGGMDSCPGC